MCNAWFEAAVPPIIVRAFGLRSSEGRYDPGGHGSRTGLATQVRDWTAAPFVEAGMGLQEVQRESLS
jgi:hypothetical protein